MKKILISALLLICSFSAFSQKKFETNGALEFGYENRIMVVYSKDVDGNYTDQKNPVTLSPYVGAFYFDAKFRGFTFFTNTRTYFTKGREVYFRPLQTEYNIGLKYTYKFMTLEASHLCSHSIDKTMYKDGYDRITLKIDIF